MAGGGEGKVPDVWGGGLDVMQNIKLLHVHVHVHVDAQGMINTCACTYMS